MAHFLYILYIESRDRYYIGQTEDVEARLVYHNSAWVPSTIAGRPWRVVFTKMFYDRSAALKEESRLKR